MTVRCASSPTGWCQLTAPCNLPCAVVLMGAGAPQPESAAKELVSITVDGSTHTRTAEEWLALARAELRSEKHHAEDAIPVAQRIIADYAKDAELPGTLRRGRTEELQLAEAVIDFAMRLMRKAEHAADLAAQSATPESELERLLREAVALSKEGR